jgi:hypothetical protein
VGGRHAALVGEGHAEQRHRDQTGHGQLSL